MGSKAAGQEVREGDAGVGAADFQVAGGAARWPDPLGRSPAVGCGQGWVTPPSRECWTEPCQHYTQTHTYV